MKKIVLIFIANIIAVSIAFSQCQPYVKIDGNVVIANQISATGLTLPLWLKEGQTIAPDQMVNSISAIEFTVNPSTFDLTFSQVLSITSSQTVPSSKVWKVESIVKMPSFGNASSVTFNADGVYTFQVPACADYICCQVWGAGGGGGSGGGSGGAGGGGGGGYGSACFNVVPSSTYTVTVGAGGTQGNSGGASSVGALISASGGSSGAASPSGAGGAGGTSTATLNISGANGKTGGSGNCSGGAGGGGGNGGAGGACCACSTSGYTGNAIGGGGGGGSYNGGSFYGSGKGAAGQVIISW